MFETFTAVMMLIVFLVPGFIWRTMEGQLIYLDHRLEWEKLALGLLARSTILYLPFTPLLYKAWRNQWYNDYPVVTGLVFFGFILLLPVVFGLMVGKARQRNWNVRFLNWLKLDSFEHHHAPTAWDAVFNQVPACWILVTLKNGQQIKGYLGARSHISSDPEYRDLYISHLLAPDHSEFVKNTNGIYIKGDEIRTIELIHPVS
ncbi:MAG: DUF6338 family protein [Methylacidiphilales bacterium]|nr:DUF6338 family protein [Candidatus Methylacidiphilales bacterium]